MPSVTCTLIYVEGDTEEVFYRRCKDKWYKSAPTKLVNLGGNFNIINKILDDASERAEKTDFVFSVCICIDKESRSGKAQVDLDVIRAELDSDRFPEIKLFEAVQDIESWFFHDIETIYSFLKTPHASRNLTRYSPVEKLNNKDMSTLFKSNKREYRKGQASQNFIDKLNIDLIKSKSAVFSSFISLLESRKR